MEHTSKLIAWHFVNIGTRSAPLIPLVLWWYVDEEKSQHTYQLVFVLITNSSNSSFLP